MLDAIIFHEDGSRSVIVDGVEKPFDEADLSEGERAEALLAVAPSSAPVVPETVTRFQARAALHLAGLLPAVEAMMGNAQTDALARIAWQDAQEFRRSSPTVAAMAAALGLTAVEIDRIFIVAEGVSA